MFQIKNALHLDAEVKYKHNAEFGFLLYLQPVIVGWSLRTAASTEIVKMSNKL